MKTVFRTDEVAHIWAQRTQREGRNHGNLFFEGDSIYSYGRHFEIARFVGKNTVLFTARDYSVTTSQHKSSVRWAIDHERYTVVTVPVFPWRGKYTDREHRENAAYFVDRILMLIRKQQRARKYSYLDAIARAVTEFQIYARIFKPGRYLKKFQRRLLACETVEEVINAASEVIEGIRRAEREDAALRRRQIKAASEKEAEQLERWKAGEDVRGRFHGQPPALRLKGGTIETSWGASVPASVAAPLYKLCKGVRVTRQPWQCNGMQFQLGAYRLDRIEEDGSIKAGCHRIGWAELERIAQQMNLS